MSILQALRIGIQRANETKRMIAFAWLLNLGISLLVVFPMLSQLDQYIRGTLMEERLLEQIDTNWFQTFQADNREDPLVRTFDYTIFGYAPFLVHGDAVLSGTMITNVGHFFVDLLFRWRVGIEYLGPLTILACLYLVVSTFLAGGFVGMYAKSYRLTFQEFLAEGARYVGRFFRISLVSLLVYMILFDTIFDWWKTGIADLTADESSELVPFVHYMIRNAVILISLGLLTLCFDYAKIRMVVDDRVSALFAFWAGVKFVGKHFASTAGLFLLLSAAEAGCIVLYAFLQGIVPMTGYWTILFVFLLQQAYVCARLWLKANWYASQTRLYQELTQTDSRAEVARA